MSFPRYESYRDSGIEWLGEVPSHWKTTRLGFEAWVRARLGWKGLKAEEYVETGYALLSTPNIKRAQIDFASASKITLQRYEESPEIKLRINDVLLAKDGSTLGTVNLVRCLPEPATVNSSLAVISPNPSVIGGFLLYYFQSDYVTARIQEQKGGMGVPHLFQDDIVRFPLVLPSVDEQSGIVDFLDRETAKVDDLIDAQQRLIELLKEKRQAVISHAITKGLDPTAPMKPSGVEWMGDVPAHWRFKPLKHLVPNLTVGIVVEPSKFYTETGVPALRSLNVRPGGLDLSDVVYISTDANKLHSKSMLRTGDIVVVRTGQPGTAAIVPPELDGCNCIDLIIIRTDQTFCERYLCWLLSSDLALKQFEAGAGGAIQQHFNVGAAKRLVVTVPNRNEQVRISDFLDSQMIKLSRLMDDAQQAIALLQERRTALISAAVTGKIDTRGVMFSSSDVCTSEAA